MGPTRQSSRPRTVNLCLSPPVPVSFRFIKVAGVQDRALQYKGRNAVFQARLGDNYFVLENLHLMWASVSSVAWISNLHISVSVRIKQGGGEQPLAAPR